MPITPEVVLKAIQTSHDQCKDDCVHSDGFKANHQAVMAFMLDLLMNPVAQTNPPLAIFYAGVHVGYRLAQVENELPQPKEKVN